MPENMSGFSDQIPDIPHQKILPQPELEPFQKSLESRTNISETTRENRVKDPLIGLFQRLYLFYHLLTDGKNLENITKPVYIKTQEDMEKMKTAFGSIINLDDTGVDLKGKTAQYDPERHMLNIYAGREKQDDTTLESSFRVSEDTVTNFDKEKDIESGVMARALGDFVQRVGPYTRGGANSCGKAVGELLDSFGITGLPQGGRNGNTYTKILNDRPDQFKRVKIDGVTDQKSFIDRLEPGAIIVYTGRGKQGGKPNGSSANQQFGHVEILASNGKFTSFYDSRNPGGSAGYNPRFRNESFQEQTGWTGYVYYPISKKKSKARA